VLHTQESVIVDDAAVQSPFSSDPYVREQHARSILCLPLLNQGKLVGILYLENKLSPHVFAPARITVLKLLASQAAMSLENTHLYRDLAEREAKIRRLVDANIIGVFFWDFDGRILEANDAFLSMLGYEREDVLAGRLRWTELTPPDWRDRDAAVVREHKMTGLARPFEKEYFRKDGSRVPVLIGAATFEEGGSQGVAFVLDLSERKRAEEALRASNAALAHVSRLTAMGEMTASIAHEVNQPLAAIVNNANACISLLPEGNPDLEDVREALAEIINDAERASNVIGRVRQLARKAPVERTPLDLRDLIADVLALARHESATRRVTIHCETPEELPLVLGDRVQLQQVLLNLVVNGMDAMNTVEESKRVLLIRGHFETRDGRIETLVSVKDAGTGFKPVEIGRLFEPFYTTKPQGMGMGLAISRSIIEAHGGRLWAEPNQVPGATFLFSLPAAGNAVS
jgi:PAS domain S-box-containing protein